MFWVISTVFAVIVCTASFVIARSYLKDARHNLGVATETGHSQGRGPDDWRDKIVTGKIWLWATVGVFVLWFGLHTTLSSARIVDAGHVKVIYEFGQITGQIDEGFHFIAPWASTEDASIQVQRHTFEGLNAFSKETQDVFVNATLNYQISPDAVQELYRNVGASWFQRLVESRVLQTLKDETVKFPSVDVAPNRETIRAAVTERLRTQLAPYSISVVDFLLNNIDFPEGFKDSIEQKQIATQEALRAQEQVKRAQYEADQAIETARGVAESNRVTAAGEADAIRERAAGQADANRDISSSLTPEVIQFQAIQKFNDNVQIVLIPSGEGTLIDPSAFLAPAGAQNP